MQQKLISPRKLPGFWELEPEKQIGFNDMLKKIESVFVNNSFYPLDTPVLELSEILLAKSGGEIDKEVYAFSKGDTSMCLRYDFTVPLARFVAANYNNLEFPFKRYQIGKNYRGEKPQKGRWREFYQCDADIIGNEELPLVADAECVKLYDECFTSLGFDVVVEVSNRNLLYGLIEDCKDLEKANDIIVLLDKFDKIGEENLIAALKDLGIANTGIKKYIEAIKIKGEIEDVKTKLMKLSKNETYLKAISELEELDTYLKAYSCTNYVFNVGIIRGHNYYTGTVFEAYLKNYRSFGAVGGGGRYENLAGYFTDKKLPGVGMSIGLTRLYDLLSQSDLLPKTKQNPFDVYIIPLGAYTTECVEICAQLRKNGIKSEVAYDNKSFKSKMKTADRREIPFVIIVGENEVKSKCYSLKNMSTGEQENLNLEQIISKLK